MPNLVPSIAGLIENLTRQIVAVVETAVAERARATVAAALDRPAKRGPGPRKNVRALAAAKAKPAAARRSPKATAKLARSRKLQGQYLGALRSLGQADRKKVRALAKAKGVAAALALAVSRKKPKK
jgi:hypothetical protein